MLIDVCVKITVKVTILYLYAYFQGLA